MNLIILIALAVLIKTSEAQKCVYDISKYPGTLLRDNVDSPYQFALVRDTSTVFFSYTYPSDDAQFQSVYFNLKSNESAAVPGVTNGFAHAYDDQNQIVYIGGSNGIYRFDSNTRQAVYQNITEYNIWQLFYKNGLYFTTYPAEKAFLYKDGRVTPVPGLENTKAMLVAVDKDNSIVYVHESHLYRITNGETKELGTFNANGFNTDSDGNLYMSTSSDIYRITGDNVRRLASHGNIYGFAIEGENQIIYGSGDSVWRQTLTPDMCLPSTTYSK